MSFVRLVVFSVFVCWYISAFIFKCLSVLFVIITTNELCALRLGLEWHHTGCGVCSEDGVAPATQYGPPAPYSGC